VSVCKGQPDGRTQGNAVTLSAGIHFDIPSAVYFGDPCERPSLTQSIAKILLERSPRHAWLASPRLNPKWTPADDEGYDKDRAIGNAAHAYLLGRGKEVTVMPFSNFRTKDAQEARDLAFAAGHVPILPHHNDTANAMVEAAKDQLAVRGISLDGGDTEVVIAAEIGGCWYRSLVDWLDPNKRTITDYKTSAMSCAPNAVASKMKSDGVDVQAAFHEMILDQLDPKGAGRRKHRFILQENTEPYALVTFPLSETWLTLGRKQIVYADRIWRDCLAHDRWPLYPEIECPPYPGWAESRWLEREIEDETRHQARGDERQTILDAG
jgi:PDDEXK-like domain of unknown function (DUF3799)